MLKRPSLQGATSKHFPIRLAYQLDLHSFTIGITLQHGAIAVWIGFLELKAWSNPKVGDKRLAEMQPRR